MSTLISKKYGYYIYKEKDKYILQIDSGEHSGVIYQFTIREIDYLGIQKSEEEAYEVYKKLDRATLIKLPRDQAWDD